jgi:glycosyltransferase involved in cell wall biosynthesis
MSKTIGIVELYQHHEVLTHYCKLLLLSDHQIYVFCTEKLFEQLPKELTTSRINWIQKSEKSTVNAFITDHKPQFLDLDLVIVCTVFSNFNTYILLSKWVKTTLVLHNAQSWFSPLSNIRFRKNQKLADTLRLVKVIVQRQPFLRKKLLASVHKIALPNKRILNFVEKHLSEDIKTKLIALPFSAYNAKLKNETSGEHKKYISLVIPGTVSAEIRDYEMVISAFENIKDSLKASIRLVILGNASSRYGQDIISRLVDLKATCIEIKFFTSFIDQVEYDKSLQQADYILLPLKEIAQFYIFEEKTCLTKISGSVNDMIRFGKPAITSKYVSIDEKIDEQLIRYNDQKDLESILLNLSEDTLIKIDNTNFEHYQLTHLFEDFKRQISL